MSVQKQDIVAYPVGGAASASPYGGDYAYAAQPSSGTYAAPPASAYPSVIVTHSNPGSAHYSTQVQQPSSMENLPRGPPTGHWRDGLCDCFSNVWPSCGCNFIFHGGWLAGQIADKTGCTTFNGFMIPFGIIYIICAIISLFNGLGGVYYIPIIIVWIFCIFLRFHLVRRYEIAQYGGCVEFLIAFFCCSCSLCQMARHVYGYRKAFDGDSDPQAKDYYTV